MRARGSAEHSDVRRKDTMTTADLDALVLRANRAGHDSIAEYALELERVLAKIADDKADTVSRRIAQDTLGR